MYLLNYYIDEISKEIIKQFPNIKSNVEEISSLIDTPKNNYGDLAIPVFKFAKELNKNPNDLSIEFQEKINLDFCKTQAVGPFVNFFFEKEKISNELLKKVDFKFENKNKRIIIEFPSPNTNKPLHIGHLRNMLLGNSVANVLEENGYEVKRLDLINDRGVHICKSMLAYQKWGNNKTPESENKKSDHFVGDFYVKYAKESDEDPKLEEEVNQMLIDWENQNKEVIDLWEKMNNWAINGMNETFKRFNIKFDKEYRESQIYKFGKEIIIDAYEKEIAYKDESGALIINLDEYKLPEKVLIRSNGTSIYVTQDIFLCKKKFEDFDNDSKLEKSIYCIGNEQETYLQQLFAILEKLSIDKDKKCYHLSYGMVELPDGNMKSRQGNVIDTDNLIEEIKEIEKKELLQRYSDLSSEELDKRSETISMSAIRFFMLKFDAKKNIVFDKNESLRFDGETGPYAQYTYSRIRSIIKKSEIKNIDKIIFKITTENDFDLIKKLLEYTDVIIRTSKDYNVARVAHYIIELSQMINEYYTKNKVIGEEKNTMESRIFLLNKSISILKRALKVLDIDVLDVM
ncbi:MAG: arginine--tRNA ligase [Candidatus Nanoarchaeia archaeon]|nr:arginine--tRNA ligase [Candidatus Nanoarchaeia archaeon]